MERVYRDGADVLNMSIGEALQRRGRRQPVARAASRLVEKGIVVVVGGRQRPLKGLWRGGARASGSGRDRRRVGREPQAAVTGVHDLARRPRRSSYVAGDGFAPDPDRRHVRARAHRRPSTTPTTRAPPLAPRKPGGQGRARPPRHLHVRRQGRPTSPPRAPSAWSSTTTSARSTARRSCPASRSRPSTSPARRRADQRPARRGPGQLTWGGARRRPEPDGRAAVGLLRRRARGRPVAEAGHRRARRLDPLHVAGREGRLRGAERHVDGLAARRRRRRAVPAGAPAHARARRRAPPPEQRRPGARDRRRAARVRRPPGRGPARHRRRDPRDDDDHAGQALARRQHGAGPAPAR